MMIFCYDNDNDFLFERTWTRSWVPLRTTLTGERARGNIESACTHQIGIEGGKIIQYLLSIIVKSLLTGPKVIWILVL